MEENLDNEERRTIFCANLSEKISEEIFYELFLQAGPIETARIALDKDGRQKTFGFVTYLHMCSVRYAMAIFDGVKLFNKRLVLRPKLSSTTPTVQSFINPPVLKFVIGHRHETMNKERYKQDSSCLRQGARALNQINDINQKFLQNLGASRINRDNLKLDVPSTIEKFEKSNSRSSTSCNQYRDYDDSKVFSRNSKSYNQNNIHKRPDSRRNDWFRGNKDRSLKNRRR